MVILIIALIALIGYLKKNAIPHALKKEIDTTQQLNEAVGDNNGLR